VTNKTELTNQSLVEPMSPKNEPIMGLLQTDAVHRVCKW